MLLDGFIPDAQAQAFACEIWGAVAIATMVFL